MMLLMYPQLLGSDDLLRGIMYGKAAVHSCTRKFSRIATPAKEKYDFKAKSPYRRIVRGGFFDLLRRPRPGAFSQALANLGEPGSRRIHPGAARRRGSPVRGRFTQRVDVVTLAIG